MSTTKEILNRFNVSTSTGEGVSYLSCTRRLESLRLCVFEEDIEDSTVTEVLEIAYDHVTRYHPEEFQ